MFKRILVPLDGSKAAESALPYGRTLAEKLALDVELIAVTDSAAIARSVPAAEGLFLDRLVEDDSRRLTQYLMEIAKRFPVNRVHCRVEKGAAATVIIETAGADKETLIVMATHGRSGLSRWLLGSVAEKVLRGTSNALLLVRASHQARTDGQLGSVVVPLDGSELGELALPPALDLAKSTNLEVVLVRAYELPATAYYRGEDYPPGAEAFIPSYEELVAAASAEAREYLDAKVKDLRSQGLEKVRSQVLEGAAGEEIIKFSHKTRGSLIAMCTHGRSGVTRWVLGSVTEKVVRHADAPVLVVRAPT
jgi:nucleotide-binding universal stress UspA family protein